MYIRDGLSYNAPFTGPENLELFGITLHSDNSDCHLPPLILYYKGCLFFFCLFVCLFLQNLSPSLYSNFVLIGSFNVNVLDTNSPLYHSLHDILSSFNLL